MLSYFRLRKSSNPVTPKIRRGVVVINSFSTGLLGGGGSELKINGKLQRFDWNKAMLLTQKKDDSKM